MHSPTMFAKRETARKAMICLTLLIAALQVPISRCQSPTSPHPKDCRTHQQQVEQFRSTPDYRDAFLAAIAKNQNKSLQINDVLNFYKPQCDETTGEYLSKQCSPFPYCWCSTPDGRPINGTAQYDMSADYCSVIKEHSCVINGHTYIEGEILKFTPPGICGQCECLAGSISCFVNFTVDEETHYLSSDQLESFKTQLVQIFSALRNNSDDIDIRQVLKMPIASDDSFTETKKEILQWKFTDYDRNGDNVLNPTEEFIFLTDVRQYYIFNCSDFHDQLKHLLDPNTNNEISLQEWFAFFGVNSPVTNTSGEPLSGEQQPVKREARHFTRKPLHLRKKFHFVYSDGQAH